MLARTVVSVVLSFALLQLNVQRADAACSSHSESAPAAPAPGPTTPEHHGHHDAAAPAPSPDEEQCDAPLSRDCCTSVASCAFTFDANVRESDEGVSPSARAARLDRWRAPLSVNRAPEPPPPRA